MSDTPKPNLITKNSTTDDINSTTKSTSQLHFLSLRRLRIFPTSFLGFVLFFLFAYNAFSMFFVHVPFPAETPPVPVILLPEKAAGKSVATRENFSSSSPTARAKLTSTVLHAVKEENPPLIAKTHLPTLQVPASFSPEKADGKSVTTRKRFSSSSSPPPARTKLTISLFPAVKEENPPAISKTHLPILPKSQNLVLQTNNTSIRTLKRAKRSKPKFKILRFEPGARQFSARVKEFFSGENGSNSSCKVRFFITRISSFESFGDRDLFTLESVFKAHPNACILIVSDSIDSRKGMNLLRPFVKRGFRVTVISPDFNYIFKNTYAQVWFDRLKRGNIDPGEIALGQNLSNLLRLALLYKYGGIYLDSDVIVLKNLAKLRNVIGAQTVDPETGNWTRLNNAVLIFDKKHPLLYKFIEEFALTFNGNKWGHNGPYLVSRVVSRVLGKPGFDFTVLPPLAFYPIDWSRIHSLFHRPRDLIQSRWFDSKLEQIRGESFAVHLWNKHSRKLKIEDGSVISRIISDCCIFCQSSESAL